MNTNPVNYQMISAPIEGRDPLIASIAGLPYRINFTDNAQFIRDAIGPDIGVISPPDTGTNGAGSSAPQDPTKPASDSTGFDWKDPLGIGAKINGEISSLTSGPNSLKNIAIVAVIGVGLVLIGAKAFTS